MTERKPDQAPQGSQSLAGTGDEQPIHLDNTLASSPVPPDIEKKIKADLIAKGIGMGRAKKWLRGEDIGRY